jgi:hypothetical protein
MLQWLPSHLNGLRLTAAKFKILTYSVSPFPMSRTFAFLWFCISSASHLHNFVMSWCHVKSESKPHYKWRSVDQSMLVSSPLWGPEAFFCFTVRQLRFVDVGLLLWRVERSDICRNYNQQYIFFIFKTQVSGSLWIYVSRFASWILIQVL